MKNTIAVILAGGRGSRMGMLCRHRPKPALPFAGAYRVIDFSLSNCLHSGIPGVAVLTDYRRESLTDYLKQWNRGICTGNDMKMAIIPPESSYLGTADAVYQNLRYLKNLRAKNVLVLAADHVYKMDYRRMLAFHEANQADVTVGVVTMEPEKAGRFGTAVIDPNHRILDFAEKSDNPCSNQVSMGIYLFRLETLISRLSEDADNPLSSHDFGYSIIPQMVYEDRAFAYQFNDYWRDIGTLEDYYRTNIEFAALWPDFGFDEDWPIMTARKRLPKPQVSSWSRIHNSIISPGSTVKGSVENSVISPGVWIDENVVIRNSVLMEDIFIDENSLIESCILDKNVYVGQSCHISTYDALSRNNGIQVLGRETSVSSDTFIGNNKTKWLGRINGSYQHIPGTANDKVGV